MGAWCIYITSIELKFLLGVILFRVAWCDPGLLSRALELPIEELADEITENENSKSFKFPTVVGGITNLTEAPATFVRLKKNQAEEVLEVDCEESMFMSPFHYPVNFSGNFSIKERMNPTCRWNFIGTEPCIPMLSCPEFNLKEPNDSDKCADEYFEVTDGYKGVQRYCGNKGPINISSSEDLRDLYITFKIVTKDENDEREEFFKCTVMCSSRGAGVSLPKTIVQKENPKCQCGNKPNDDRIVNGDNATKGEFPWLVAMVEAKTRQPFCGGSIINNRIIVTAAHCFKGKFLDLNNIDILLHAHILDVSPNPFVIAIRPDSLTYNATQLKALDSGNGTYRHKLEAIMVHPLYVGETNDFDVAVMVLAKPINFAKLRCVSPICIPKLGSYHRTFSAKKAWVAGWGLPGPEAESTVSRLQKLEVNVFSPKECKDFYAHRVNRRMLCAGYAEGDKDACAGDSGGPLVLEDRKKVWYQIGSVSWGESCAIAGNPGVYFRTTEAGQWISYHSNVNDAEWCAVP